MKRRRAFVTGVNGQDGSYLVELLLVRGYEVHGLLRPAASFSLDGVRHLGIESHDLRDRLILHRGDLTDGGRLSSLLAEVMPHEVYNLAAQSKVRASFDDPEGTGESSGLGAVRLLQAARDSHVDCRFYQASSSEMFGGSLHPHSETTPFHPRSPYAAAKAYAFWMTTNYREAYGMFAVNGILFNHESPRRGLDFVTRKITHGAAAIKAGRISELNMGNLSAVRDWGYAAEYVEGMWRMMQTEDPSDYVLATGKGYTVKQFLDAAFNHAGLDWQDHVRFDEQYLRPTEVDVVVGDPSKAERELQWTPLLDGLDLARLMVDADLDQESGPGPWVDAARVALWRSMEPC